MDLVLGGALVILSSPLFAAVLGRRALDLSRPGPALVAAGGKR